MISCQFPARRLGRYNLRMALAHSPTLAHEDIGHLAETLTIIDEISRSLVALVSDDDAAIQCLLQQITDAACYFAGSSAILVAWEKADLRASPRRQAVSGDWPHDLGTFPAPPESPAWTAIRQQRPVLAGTTDGEANWWPLIAGGQLAVVRALRIRPAAGRWAHRRKNAVFRRKRQPPQPDNRPGGRARQFRLGAIQRDVGSGRPAIGARPYFLLSRSLFFLFPLHHHGGFPWVGVGRQL